MAKSPIDSTKKQETFDTATEQKTVDTSAKAKVKEFKPAAKAEAVDDKNVVKKENDPMPAMAVTKLPGYEITEVTFDQIKASMIEKLKSRHHHALYALPGGVNTVVDSFFGRLSESLTRRNGGGIKFFKAVNPTSQDTIYFDDSSVIVDVEDSGFGSGFDDYEEEEDLGVVSRHKDPRGNVSLVLFSKIYFEKLQGVNVICSVSCVHDSEFTNAVIIPENYYSQFWRNGSKEHALTSGRIIIKDSVLYKSKNNIPARTYTTVIARKSTVVDTTLPADFDLRNANLTDCVFPHASGSFCFCTLKNVNFSTYRFNHNHGGAGMSVYGTRDKRISFSDVRVGVDERYLAIPEKQNKTRYGAFFGLSHPMHLATFKNAFLGASNVTMVHTANNDMVINIEDADNHSIGGGAFISQSDSMELIRAKIAAVLNDKEVPTTEQQTLLLPLQPAGCGPLANPFDRRFDEPMQRTIDTLVEIVASRLNIYRMLSQLNCN